MARKKKSSSLSDYPAPTPFRPAAGSLSRNVAPVQTESVQHGTITPVSTYTIRGCCTKPKGGKTCNAFPRPGQVDLVFPSAKDTAKYKIKPGPTLQFCTGLHKGHFLPVKDPWAAKKIAQDYVACVAGRKSKVKSCLPKVMR